MKKNRKRMIALFCVILLILLYIAALVVAILDFPGSDRMFAACLLATVGLPILLWIYIWVYGKFTGRHTIADTAIPQSHPEKTTPEDKEPK